MQTKIFKHRGRIYYKNGAFSKVKNIIKHFENTERLEEGEEKDTKEIEWQSTPALWKLRPNVHATTGLPISPEYCKLKTIYAHGSGRLLRKPKLFCILSRHSARKEQRESIVYGRSFNFYTIIRTKDEIVQLFKSINPADRHFEEVVYPDTPHKFFMDIEKELHGILKSEQEELSFLKSYLFKSFIPLIADFYSHTLGIQINESDVCVADASLIGKKFSVHLVVSPQGNNTVYFKSRRDTFVLAGLLFKFIYDKMEDNKELKRWYFTTQSTGESIIDWSIYGDGARNMRTIGSCKLQGLVVGKEMDMCRIFSPVPAQTHYPWSRFFVSAYDMVGVVEPYTLEERHFETVAKFVGSLVSGHNLMLPPTFKKLRNYENISKRRTPTSAHNGPQETSFVCGADVNDENDDAFSNPFELEMIKQIRSGRDDPIYMATKELFKERSYKFFIDVVEDVMKRYGCSGLNYTIPVSQNNTELYTSRFFPGPRTNGEPRWCLSKECSSGSRHYVQFSCSVRFDVTYFCYACLKRIQIVAPCVSRFVFKGGSTMSSRNYPENMKYGLIYYTNDYEPDLENGETCTHMRNLRPINGRFLESSEKRTIILHGSMGSGKTQTVKKFISNCRQENSECSILAISFRRVLSIMFSEVFELDHYNDTKISGSIFECQNLSIQLESLYKLVEWMKDETSNEDDDLCLQETHGPLARKVGILNRKWDVIIIDEIESVLEQFMSHTMDGVREATFTILVNIVKNCNCFVIADADISERSWFFLNITRATDEDPERPIKNLEFHRNPFVSSKTKYIDYCGQFEFIQSMLNDLVIHRKKVFFVSNSAKYLKKVKHFVETHIMSELEKYMRNGDDSSEIEIAYVSFLIELRSSIKLIHGEMSNTEKANLVNCNTEWLEYRLLMISPTVGAGIDFNMEHFDVVYMHGSSHSNTSRGLMQMKGRVRKVKDQLCHVFLSDDPSASSSAQPSKPVELDTCYSIIKSQVGKHHDRLESFTNDLDVVRFETIPINRDLLKLSAYNEMIKNRSSENFRFELLGVITAADPVVEYIFTGVCDIKKNIIFAKQLNKIGSVLASLKIKQISKAEDKTKEELDFMTKLDNEKALVNTKISDISIKNRYRHYFGISKNIFSRAFENVFISTGGEDSISRVENCIWILFASAEFSLFDARNNEGVENCRINWGGGVSSLTQMAGDAISTHKYDLRTWLYEALFLGGFNLSMCDTDGNRKNNFHTKLFGMFGKTIEAHTNVSAENIEENPLMYERVIGQTESNQMFKKSMHGKMSSIPRKKMANIAKLCKLALSEWFGLELTSTDEFKKCIKCDEHCSIDNPWHIPQTDDSKAVGAKRLVCRKRVVSGQSWESMMNFSRARLIVLKEQADSDIETKQDGYFKAKAYGAIIGLIDTLIERRESTIFTYKDETPIYKKAVVDSLVATEETENTEDLDDMESQLKNRVRLRDNYTVNESGSIVKKHQKINDEGDYVFNQVELSVKNQFEDFASIDETEIMGDLKEQCENLKRKDMVKNFAKSRYIGIQKTWVKILEQFTDKFDSLVFMRDCLNQLPDKRGELIY